VTIGLDHVSVTTADLDASLRFYRDLLGLPLVARGESDEEELAVLTGLPAVSIEWAELTLSGECVLELLHYVRPVAPALVQLPCDPGTTHIGLSVQDIDALHDRLVDAGVEVVSGPVALREDGWKAVRCLYAKDPDGVTIELVERARLPDSVVVPDLEAVSRPRT